MREHRAMTNELSFRHNFLGFKAVATKLWKELQRSFDNNMNCYYNIATNFLPTARALIRRDLTIGRRDGSETSLQK